MYEQLQEVLHDHLVFYDQVYVPFIAYANSYAVPGIKRRILTELALIQQDHVLSQHPKAGDEGPEGEPDHIGQTEAGGRRLESELLLLQLFFQSLFVFGRLEFFIGRLLLTDSYLLVPFSLFVYVSVVSRFDEGLLDDRHLLGNFHVVAVLT